MKKIKAPFFVCNTKSYLYGKENLDLALAAEKLAPNIILYEPPELIESGKTGNDKYIIKTKNKIKKINDNILVMYGGGINNGADVYNILEKGIDGTGATSGIMKATNKINKLEDMISGAAKIKDE